jgi:hypothetical protein
MWMELLEGFMERVWPSRWAEYQSVVYDYDGEISRDQVHDWRGAEIWCACPGKRLRPVEVVRVNGVRKRVIDSERGSREFVGGPSKGGGSGAS